MTPKVGSIKNKKKRTGKSRGSLMTPKVRSVKNKKKEPEKVGLQHCNLNMKGT